MTKRGALLALALAGTILAAAAGACTSFSSAPSPSDAEAPDDGASDAAPDGPTDGGGGVSPDAAFCASQPASATLCDDFEGTTEPRTEWQVSQDGGGISIVTAADRPGHVVRVAANDASENINLSFTFVPDYTKSDVALDLDFEVLVPGFNYTQLVDLQPASESDGVFFYAIAMGAGLEIGGYENPLSAPNVPVDMGWHHFRASCTHAGGFHQVVKVDDTVITDTMDDLTAPHPTLVSIGLSATVVNNVNGPAVLLYDDVLLWAQ